MSAADILIIGAGMGGATLAAALAPTGRRIVILERGEPDKNKELIDFQKAYVLFKLKKWEESELLFLQITQQPGNLKDYAFYFLGKIYQNKSRFVESEKYYKLVDGLNPNVKLKIEAKKSLAQLLLLQKNPKAAYDILLNALRFRRTAPELQKLYVLQCLKLYLTDFAEEGLQDLAHMTTATDYQAFLKTYQAQRALIEKERESFR